MRNSQSLSYQSLVKCSPLHIDGERAEWRGRVAHSCYITIGGGGGRRIHISVRVRPAPKSTLPLGRAARSSLARIALSLFSLIPTSCRLCLSLHSKAPGGTAAGEGGGGISVRAKGAHHPLHTTQRADFADVREEQTGPIHASEQARSEEGGRQSGRRREDEEEQEQEGASELGLSQGGRAI